MPLPDGTCFASWMPGAPNRAPAELGGKAVGLLSLPQDWTPPFVILGRAFYEAWARDGGAALVLRDADVTNEALLDVLIEYALGLERADGLIVRSNSPTEALDRQRGMFRSIPVEADHSQLMAAIDEVLRQGKPRRQPVFAIVQVRMRREAAGHLSNERRVSERASRWLVEETDPNAELLSQWHLNVRGETGDGLEARDRRQLGTALRRAARQVRGGRDRVHCEWVWDGRRVWIVQRDVVRPEDAPRVRSYLTSGAPVAPDHRIAGLSRIRRLNHAEADVWGKVRKPAIFDSLGTPTASVFFLDGQSFLADAETGYGGLGADLRILLSSGWPLVVRCDFKRSAEWSDLSLPTSDPMTSVEELTAFMEREGAHFRSQGLSPAEWAFLPAWLVPARASVMVLARPGGQLTHLDALWGFPDGVGLLLHDTYFHRVDRDTIERRTRFKGSGLFWSPVEGWVFEAIPAPHDWKVVLDDSEVRTASSWARRLADHLGHEVQLMVLAQIGGQSGPGAMLPWHYTDHRMPPLVGDRVPTVPSAGIVTIRDGADLGSATLTQKRGIVLRPRVEVRRDPEFLADVGRRAAEAGVPIYFEGSLLGHAYYILREAHAEVVPVGPEDPGVQPDEYNKLVRDRVPEIIRRGGATPRVARASPENAMTLLKHKLIEEAVEVWTSDTEDLEDELADLTEVLQALCERAGVDGHELEQLRIAKRQARGGFDDLVYLEATVPEGGGEASRTRPGRPLLGLPVDDEHSFSAPDHSDLVAIEERDEAVLFRVPITPPLQGGLPLREHVVHVGGSEVTFHYVGRYLEISIEAPQAPPVPGQLSLAIEAE